MRHQEVLMVLSSFLPEASSKGKRRPRSYIRHSASFLQTKLHMCGGLAGEMARSTDEQGVNSHRSHDVTLSNRGKEQTSRLTK